MISRRTKLASLISALSVGIFTSACAAEVVGHADLVGRWGGILGTGPNALRLVLEISAGQPITLVSVDQGNARIPATGGNCSAAALSLQFGAVSGRLELRLTPQGTLAGTWSQGREQEIVFSRLAAGQNPATAAPAPFENLQIEVDKARVKSGTPALAGAFMSRMSGSLIVREAVSGVRVTGESAPVTQGQNWHVGSITKSMTATLVARLVERGLLSWDMKLGTVFAGIAPEMLSAYRDVTLSQLMTGQSGIPTNISTVDLFGHVAAKDETPTQRRLVWTRQALALTPLNTPGAGFVYPNNGYVLAGALCEKVTGKAYETLMIDEVFAPLGMTSAGFGPPALGNPQGHRKALIGSRLLPVGVDSGADNPAPMAPAGRAHMTLVDLAKFGLAHSEGHQGLNNAYLTRDSWRFLHTPPVRTARGNDYAYGWIVRGDGTLWHNGSNTYWLAELSFDPAKSITACACANVAGTEEAVSRVLAAGLANAAS